MKQLFILLALSCKLVVNAQSDALVFGKVIDADTREPLVSASVYYRNGGTGTMTNENGDFAIDKSEDSDTLTISYLGYASTRFAAANVPQIVTLKRYPVQLSEITVIPIDATVKKMWNKYNEIYKAEKNNKKRKRHTFFYRQIAKSDSLYNEFVESFFTGYDDYGIDDLRLEKGRYAQLSDTCFKFSIRNFFTFTRVRPFYQKKPPENVYNTFIQPNSTDIYDITLEQIISTENGESVYVIVFTPKENKPKSGGGILSGKLFVRKSDLAVIKIECETHEGMNVDFIKKAHLKFSVNYADVENFAIPIVESVKCSGEFDVFYNLDGKMHKAFVNSFIFRTGDYSIKSTGKKIKFNEALVKEIAKMKYDAEFWRNNPIVKRTQIEEEIIESFENKKVFGNFQP